MNLLPDEIILHILHFIPDHECFHSTCFTRKNWVLNIWPKRKQVLSLNHLSELDRYLHSVKSVSSSSKTKIANIGSTAGSINASATAPHIEEKKVKIIVLFDAFEKFTNLKQISLVNCGLNDSILEKICTNFKRKLITLNISKNKNLTWNNTQRCIMLCENLKKLDLSYNFQSSNMSQQTLGGASSNGSDNSTMSDLWVQTVQFPKSVEWVNVSGFLNQIPNFELLYILIERFSEKTFLKNNPFEGVQIPYIRAFAANHLTDISIIKPEKCQKLMSISIPSLVEMYHHCFLYLKSAAFSIIYDALHFYPSEDLIYECILKGHVRVLELLASVDYVIDNTPIDVIEESILNGNSSLVSKLRVLNYHYFNELSDDLLDQLICKGDTLTIMELRACNLNRQKWDQIKVSSIEEAVRNGSKDVLEHVRMLNLTELLNQVAVEHVEYSLEKGHSGVLKQLAHANYPKFNDISPQVLASVVLKSPALESTLKKVGYSKLNEVKSLMKKAIEETTSTTRSKSQKKKK
ncbi:hypothetical protein C9374_011104 [Naegleria lovaniensis]|uniref:F-box domain-containing protein n=1 Tax=Naegleria lovaniensis TaxID=51637 RepID=A0AA88G9R6_NAELO|nr:uncharacterized protein C9374_011104 [Naegleria lovaniensis]KAG2374025.1 hypothetical protein C9374_011104 [Naegleria lovaniensis]